VIHDASGSENHPPEVKITRPSDGSVFLLGNPIAIRAEAADSDGTIERLDLLADGQLLSSTKLSVLEFTWNNVPEGRHTLVARAVDDDGAEGHSSEVRILVRRPELL